MNAILSKIPVQLFFLLGLAFFGYDYYSFRTAVDSPYVMKKNDLSVSQKSVETLQNKVKEGQSFISSFEKKREELRGIFSRLNEIKFSIAEEIDPASVMKNLASEAKIVGVTLTSVYPLQPKDQEYYIEYPFELKFRGAYVQLIVFLKRLSSLQTIITVEDVEIHSTGTAQKKYADIEGTVRVKAYRYRSSKADELQNKGAQAPAGGAK